MIYRDIPFTEYESVANALLRKHGISERDLLPIDPETLIRKEGLVLNTSLPLHKLFGIRGCVVKKNGRLEICIDEYHYMNEPESCLLTIGEELGHCILHLQDFEKIRSISDWMRVVVANRAQSRFIENQARMVGCHILLPTFIFGDFLVDWVGKNLKSVEAFRNPTIDLLLDNLATLLEDEIPLSHWILNIALGRWSDRPIDRVTKAYPQLLQKSRAR
jgi:hypothetical protein